MLILIDGYNLIAPPGRAAADRLPAHRRPDARWLQDQRQRLIQRLAVQLRPDLAVQTTIVFDAADAPAGLPDRLVEQGINIEFAVGYDEADDRIEELISLHSSPKRLVVVSSDHRVQTAATRRGALAVDGEPWLDRLADGRPWLAIPWPPMPSDDLAGQTEKPTVEPDVQIWLREFEIRDEPAKKRPPNWHPFPKGYGEDLL